MEITQGSFVDSWVQLEAVQRSSILPNPSQSRGPTIHKRRLLADPWIEPPMPSAPRSVQLAETTRRAKLMIAAVRTAQRLTEMVAEDDMPDEVNRPRHDPE